MAAFKASRLVWSARPRITSSTLPMSRDSLARSPIRVAVLCTSALMRSMALTVSCTRSRPSPADVVAFFEASDVLTALRATSSTALVISLTAVAACSISLFCRVRPRALSSVTLLSSSAADASCVAEPEMRCSVSRSFSCIFDMASSKRPASSWPSTVIGRVRLPSAICSAAPRALAIGWVMLLVSNQASSSVKAVAITNRVITRLNAESY
ncbi:hypothetical protein D3C71_1255360 [compost metagenome]